MYDDLEAGLRALATDRVPAALATIDGDVLTRVAGHRFRPGTQGSTLTVAMVSGSLLMGMAGGLLPAGRVEARSSLAPLAEVYELGPAGILLEQL